jgi:hypothetical protein
MPTDTPCMNSTGARGAAPPAPASGSVSVPLPPLLPPPRAASRAAARRARRSSRAACQMSSARV